MPIRERVIEAAQRAADGLAARSERPLAFQFSAIGDSTSATRHARPAWYQDLAAGERSAQLANQRRVAPVRATMTAGALILEWSINDAAPWVRNREGSAGFGTEFEWLHDVELDSATGFRVRVSRSRAPTYLSRSTDLAGLLSVASGDITHLEPASVFKYHFLSSRVTREARPDALTFTVADTTVIRALHERRPRDIRFRFLPCPDTLATGASRCVDARVPIEYR